MKKRKKKKKNQIKQNKKKKELDEKEILKDEKSGKKIKSFNSKFPADPGNYPGIYIKKKKK